MTKFRDMQSYADYLLGYTRGIISQVPRLQKEKLRTTWSINNDYDCISILFEFLDPRLSGHNHVQVLTRTAIEDNQCERYLTDLIANMWQGLYGKVEPRHPVVDAIAAMRRPVIRVGAHLDEVYRRP